MPPRNTTTECPIRWSCSTAFSACSPDAFVQPFRDADSNAAANKCRHQRKRRPVAFHSALSLQNGVLATDVGAIRQGQLPAGDTLAALSRLAHPD